MAEVLLVASSTAVTASEPWLVRTVSQAQTPPQLQTCTGHLPVGLAWQMVLHAADQAQEMT